MKLLFAIILMALLTSNIPGCPFPLDPPPIGKVQQ